MGEVIRFDRNGQRVASAPVRSSVDAPYVETDRSQLGDRHLSPEEAVIREREELLKLAAHSKIHGQAELEDQERSAGSRMHYTEIISRILRINPNIKVLDGVKGSVALYRLKSGNEYDAQERDWSKPEFFWHHKYVGGMEKQWLPEYPHVLLDSSGLPTKEIRGWRSVLLSLIKGRAITIDGANKEFGNPMCDRRSGRWFEQLHEFRSKHGE